MAALTWHALQQASNTRGCCCCCPGDAHCWVLCAAAMCCSHVSRGQHQTLVVMMMSPHADMNTAAQHRSLPRPLGIKVQRCRQGPEADQTQTPPPAAPAHLQILQQLLHHGGHHLVLGHAQLARQHVQRATPLQEETQRALALVLPHLLRAAAAVSGPAGVLLASAAILHTQTDCSCGDHSRNGR